MTKLFEKKWREELAKIKICGLKRLEDIEYVNELMPDYIGFVFAGEKRKIDKSTAKILKAHLNKEILSVGVFVNEPIENIVDLVHEKIIDMVQLHGNENEMYIRSIKELVDVPIIKAIRVSCADNILNAKNLPADFLLLDKYSKKDVGGTGKSFDWSLVPKGLENYFLAGGLGVSNLSEAIRKCDPYAVDLSSSVETEGFKDKDKMKEVIDIVRSIN